MCILKIMISLLKARDVPKRKLFDSASNEYLMKLLGESESESEYL